MSIAEASRGTVAAMVVERFTDCFDFSTLSIAQRTLVRHEVETILKSSGAGQLRLRIALQRLLALVDSAAPVRPSKRKQSKRLLRLLRILAPLALTSAGTGLIVATPAYAYTTPAVGDSILNPATNSNETVTALVSVTGSPAYAVQTSAGHVILLANSVNDTYVAPNSSGVATTYTVTAVSTTTYGSGSSAKTYTTGVTIKDSGGTSKTYTVVQAYTPPPTVPDAGGSAGSGSSTPVFSVPSGNEQYQNIKVGANGGDGRDGGGVNICVPFTSYCYFVGYAPTAGGNGATGPNFTIDITTDTLPSPTADLTDGLISNTADSTPAIKVASIGGNGGAGGDSYSAGGYSGQPGGAAGNGGNVSANNYLDVSTGGKNSFGMWVFSQAGSAGSGGSGYIATGGGTGGGAAAGGNATGNNYGDITTLGDGAVGLLVQSLGGAGGSGGSSYGIVGSAGSGSVGGNGGNATAYNAGTIKTKGDFAYGVQAQSVGGNGGSSGNAAGIVAFGGTAGGAGTGGAVTVHLGSTSDITTVGKNADGVLAQSIGGGGGSTGWSGGAVSFGGSAGSGGTGGNVNVTTDSGSKIETFGYGSFGIFAESVGGNGGSAGGTGGVFTMGGSGGSGNVGGTVTVSNYGGIYTHGVDARGIFAQSVGGGGGTAITSGGLVTLGGSGGSGGDGGSVSITLGTNSKITTISDGADGAFAQSIGGGGGSGGTAGGLFALGGTGSVGGTGGSATVTNAGEITTKGDDARGIFAQSVGGGGGSGGDGYGLAAIGGGSSAAGNGGIVTVGNTGTIATFGDFSTAMLGQSIGGGGGNGGSTGGVLLTIGGSGSGGGTGGEVTANLSGSLSTIGDDSHGLFAQSVGGGGGNGGSSTSVSLFAGLALGGSGSGGGLGGDVIANFTQQNVSTDGGLTILINPTIYTEGDRSRGVFLQSVGGGGGSGGMAVQVSAGAFAAASFAIGGAGASGGDGGTVTANGDVDIQTKGDGSEGFFAQSVGGGGGNGGASVSVAASVGEGVSGALSVSIGGEGGSGGKGGTVTIDSGGSIVTGGTNSTGFVAQSVGGGGGSGGFSISVAGAASDGVAVTGGLGIGGSGGSGGQGGTVDATFDGSIFTGFEDDGDQSVGALIQSIGGGGGSGGFNVSATIGLSGGTSAGAAVGLGGSGGSGGIGGDVTGRIGGDVTTTGDQSTGVLIQSAGGGGGSGGFNVSGNIGLSGGIAAGATVGLGGAGGGGGKGGTVIGQTDSQVETFGKQSDGVVIQSVGGGGGTGGFNVNGSLTFGGTGAGSIDVGLGGTGGGAGDGGVVTGTVNDTVITHDDQSRGVLVQSVGGGGGAGGFNVTGGISAGGTGAMPIGIGLGGTGGGGGSANIVTAHAKSVYTEGDDSAGFTAQSIGGGGGVGGFNVTGGASFGGTGAGTISIGLGGSGGSGGSAMKVTADLTGIAETHGDRSTAILAQSVGGGGGSGAFNVSGGLAFGGTGGGALAIGLGGSGGSAGNAGGVDLTLDGYAYTDGIDSAGIVAQSVGGGGGTGGFNVSGGIAAGGTGAGQVGFGLGGSGGGGGNAGEVDLWVNDGVTTSDATRIAAITNEDSSYGIIAQSLGGGGGNGGFNVTGGASFAGTGAGGVNVGIGGMGGDGGYALDATADISGYVLTGGNDSVGIMTQSIGGGGGNGGFNVAGGLTIAGTGSGTLNVGVGGAGGDGGKAGNATLSLNDEIATPGKDLVAAITQGDRSTAIVAQSIGGGGGNGGFNVTGGINIAGTGSGGVNIGIGGMGGDGGIAGNASADITGGVATHGTDADGIVVQSIGGGGGDGGFNVSGTISVARNSGGGSIGIGGFGGDGGNGGEATLNLNQRTDDSNNTLAAVSTEKDGADAIIVQSLGGGGGNGGFNISGSVSFAQGGAGNLGIGVGGFGGGAGDGVKATANIRGDVLTGGDNANGILVQSMGGGGGNGGFNVTAGLTASKGANGNIGIGVGGFGGDGGNGGVVNATIESDVATGGDNSYGVSLQSLGGGGGNGGFNVTGGVSLTYGTSASGNFGIGIGGFGGLGGHSDDVTAEMYGDIQTSGAFSHGLLAQSVGGGGGNGGFNVTGGLSISKGANGSMGVGIGGFGGDGGYAEDVTASLYGDVLTTGLDSDGVTFQSLGGGGGNGAFNVTGGVNMAFGSGTSGNLNVGIGGFGGDGGYAGLVDGTVIGNVETDNNESHGILLQSLGGGGGNGSMNVSGGIAFTKSSSGSVSFGLGGFGGDGGDAGEVKALLVGDVTTLGDSSAGAVMQSIGGAGGNGALNVSGNITVSKGDSTSGAVALGIGGFGGGGGDGKGVTGHVEGVYYTDGTYSPGVVALSLGGGGGDGGMNVSGTVGVSTQGTAAGVSLGLGGFGGDGGNAGDVTLTRIGQTVTKGPNSDGVFAAAIGGGGGRGAMNISGGISATNTGDAGSVVIGIGGFGGGGGDGGEVHLTVTDSVWAMGSDAPKPFVPDDVTFDDGTGFSVGTKSSWQNGSNGIVAKSVGGGGGAGGINISGGISLGKSSEDSTASALVLGIGGFGGSGGDAKDVTATIGALSGPRIQVQGMGDNKSAVYVGSIGGGGGDGAINISGGITTDGSVVAGFGGAGGGGGLGRNVTATVDADLFAEGYQANGFVAQSIGGGGGAGGINISGGLKPTARTEPVITFGMGGDGGAGNSSGSVHAQQDGQVIVDGYNSHGVLVQSVAGGGGAGGMNITANLNRSNGDSKIDGFAAGIGIGGTGGSGGTAGDVYLRSTGNILINTVVGTADDGSTTLSAGSEAGISTGITAQSIGGGGGTGGFDFVGVIAPKGNPLVFAMGGSGGVGGDAGNVTVVRGYNADGTVNASLINTFGIGSAGLVAQSIGGGGGDAGTNLSFALGSTKANETGFGGLFQIGGDGATSGDGKDVTVFHAGDIQTDGFASDGILAQSIGKGGGNAAVNVGFMKLGEATDGVFTKSTQTSTVNGFALTIGGAAGDAGSAGTVTVDHDGTIITKQAQSNGIVAQSLAGGGGNVALNLGAISGTDNNLKTSIGREGGKGGIAGDVSVTSKGLILVSGDNSNGIVAQSVGGAGGMSGSISVEGQLKSGSGTNSTKSGFGLSVGLDGGAGGHSGTVTVDNDADIQTDGTEARGIIAQSIGGDGGIAGSARVLTTGQADSLAVAVGGGGGSGAMSGNVIVGNGGTIVTSGDKSDGILAQSIGGSGGVGGSASTLKFPVGGLKEGSATTVAVAVGGSGGDGAVAGDVDVTNDGIISTTGESAFGIRAQSIGGGGGVGGATYNIETQAAKGIDSLNVLIGGGGGDGQKAGNVNVFNYGLIQTTGDYASGISANSIGGGGGDAGSVTNSTWMIAQSSGKTNSFQMSIGGAGGSGGTGGDIHVVNMPTDGENSGVIITTGYEAHGIFAQSVGGGGGNGTSVYSQLLSTGAKDSISIGLNLGGAGGDGNTGGDVIVENGGSIHTTGDGSDGILAQSIGGGGGDGGVVLSANVLLKSRDKSPLISLGGIGGAGNDGGHVTVNNSGSILTEGNDADGIVAQSIGGGGGNAGLSLALTGELKTLVASNVLGLVVGAAGGGTAGVGGQVDVVHSGDITVLGEGSQAIVAESINGGGGSTHFDMSGIAMPSISAVAPEVEIPDLGELDGIPNLVKGEPVNKPVAPVIVAARVGADDISSMNAGKVNVSITGTIGAAGDFSSGTTIRSIGGGGGTVTLSGLIAAAPPPAAGEVTAQAIYAVGLGAKDTTDSSGADIDSSQSGQIVTTGLASTGTLVQSIGGGGGSALVDLQLEDATSLDSVRLGLGGVGTSGSVGGDISRSQTGGVITTADFANGAIVQSIGGGGGTAIARVNVLSPTIGSGTPDVTQAMGVQHTELVAAVATPGMDAAVLQSVVSLGATGGTANDAGAVSLDFGGGFTTYGDFANGLIVQSIGGGGGQVQLDGFGSTAVTLGGQAGAEGNGGSIGVTNDGDVVTFGANANGILLQSIGGGGGALFGAGPNPDITLSSTNAGDGGAITLTQDGDIAVMGNGSVGILAQSLGGGGGIIDGVFAGTAGGIGEGGSIDVSIDGSIVAPGVDSSGILAQSLGSLGGGDINVAVSGDVRGGSRDGAGIKLDGGADNRVTIGGSLTAISGLALSGTYGNDWLENDGLTVGNLTLGGGNNVVHNALGATFVTISTLDLRDGTGSTGLFDNDGTLLLGLSAPKLPIDLLHGETFGGPMFNDPMTNLLYGTSVISQVALDGDFRQSATGRMTYDVAFGPYASDRIDATGSAVVDGTADITLTWLENNRDVTLISTGAGATDLGLDPIDTLAIDYGIRADATGVHLTLASDFGQDFLNSNQQQLGHSLDSSLDVGGASGLGRLLALLGNLTADQRDVYAAIFAELDPETLLTPAVEQLDAARSFGDEVLGCHANDERGAKCVFGKVEGHKLDREGGDGTADVRLNTSARLRAGAGFSAGNGWQLGLGFGVDSLGDLHSRDDRFKGVDPTGFHAGVGVGKLFGDGRGEAKLAITAGTQEVDTSRSQDIFTVGIGQAKVKTHYVGVTGGVGYTLSSGSLFARPAIDLQAIRLTIGDFAEGGLEGLGARSDGTSHWYRSAMPKLTAGFASGGVKLSGTVGYQWSSRGSIDAPIRLIGSPDASDPAIIGTAIDKKSLLLGASVEAKTGKNADLQFGIQSLKGDKVDSKSASARLVLRF